MIHIQQTDKKNIDIDRDETDKLPKTTPFQSHYRQDNTIS